MPLPTSNLHRARCWARPGAPPAAPGAYHSRRRDRFCSPPCPSVSTRDATPIRWSAACRLLRRPTELISNAVTLSSNSACGAWCQFHSASNAVMVCTSVKDQSTTPRRPPSLGVATSLRRVSRLPRCRPSRTYNGRNGCSIATDAAASTGRVRWRCTGRPGSRSEHCGG